MRRSLLSLEAGLRAGAAVAANSSTAADAAARFSAATGRRLTQQAQAFSTDIPVRLFQDPYLQAAVAAAANAETAAAQQTADEGPEPDRADALSVDPVATALAAEQQAAALNPLQLDPALLAAARYSTMALATEIAEGAYDPAWLEQFTSGGSSGGGGGGEGGEKAPALAVPGSLDYYLYGDNPAVDSGANYSE